MTDTEINEAVARKLGVQLKNLKARDYCHDIEAAWEVVDKIKDTYFSVSVSHDNERHLYQCEYSGFNNPPIYATADTAPMAICLAFLKLP